MSQLVSLSPSFQTLIPIMYRVHHDNVTTHCVHIWMFDIFFAFGAFLSPGIGYRTAVFQVCKMCAFNQSNALVKKFPTIFLNIVDQLDLSK